IINERCLWENQHILVLQMFRVGEDEEPIGSETENDYPSQEELLKFLIENYKDLKQVVKSKQKVGESSNPDPPPRHQDMGGLRQG
ncbi:hypothetical protein ACH5RR_026328, partial [Cinchona calisaya]